jgi:hypothetical protein
MDISIFINNNNIGEVQDPNKITKLHRVTKDDDIPAIKYLGVYFDPELNFKFHISQLSKKLSKTLFSLRSVKNLLPEKSLISLYYSLFHCHLIYAIEIWGNTSTSTLNELIKKQKQAIRLISNSKYNAHTQPLFKKYMNYHYPNYRPSSI